jgi:pimeloyl-ACP methyl ester carboxylesterase
MSSRFRRTATLFSLLALSACLEAPPPAAPEKGPTPVTSETKAKPPKPIDGELVTYKNGEAIGGEHFADDGTTLKSELSLAGSKATLTIDRKEKKVKVESGGQSVNHDIPPGTVVLENGSWQAYAIAAESFPSATEPTPVKVLMPAQGITVEAKIRVRPAPADAKSKAAKVVDVSLGKLEVSVELDGDGRVVHASVPLQEVEVRRAGEKAPDRQTHQKPPPATVNEELVEVKRGEVILRGSLWTPKNAKTPVPVALVIAGSGPTDRDGNSALGLTSDVYRLLAEALAQKGIATLRFDKRGVGESSLAFDVAKMTVDDSVDDTMAFLPKLRDKARFGKVSLVGHSEGGLLAMLVAAKEPVDALVLVSTAGRPLRAIVREQLAAKLDAAAMKEVDRLFADLAAGKPLERVPEGLEVLFNPAVTTYLKSEMDIDPVAKLKALKTPVTVIQGETDAQVPPGDAKLLGKARPNVKVVMLPNVNHLLKTETTNTLPQASYTDPSRPVVPGAIDAIASGIAK